MELHRIDLNLLVVFNQLMQEQRVTRVAETLGVTQPTVSNALSRLRRLLGDELFTPTPAGMVPTELARELAGPVAQAITLIQDSLTRHQQFDPAHVARAFCIGMNDIGEIVFLPSLLEQLAQDAPGITLRTVRNDDARLRGEMESGAVDLALGLLPQLTGGFYQRRLFSQRYVCLFRQGHALSRRTPSIASYAKAQHLVVESAGTGHGLVDEIMRRKGIDRHIRLSVPNYIGVGHLLRSSELVATVPERLAQHLASTYGLQYRKHPVALPSVSISLSWHARVHRSPAHQWLRGVIVELFAERASAAAK